MAFDETQSRSIAILYDHNGNPVVVDGSGRVAIQDQPNMDVAASTLAKAAQQTDGTQKAIIRGGAKGTTTAADITSSHIDDNRQGIDTRNYGMGTNDSQQVEGLAADGEAPVGNPVWMGGHDGALIRALQTVLDGTVHRLQTEAKVGKGVPGGDLVHLDAIDTDAGQGRLKATIYTADDDPVAFGAVPPNPESIRNSFVLSGSSDSLIADGSVTPVVFTYEADADHDISIQEIKFVLVSNSVTFGNEYFGARAGPLPNGVLVEVVSDGNTGTVHNLVQNESFVYFASPGGFEWVVASKDMMSSAFLIGGGLKLKAGTADVVRVTVRDNILNPIPAGVFFKCFVKGNLLS